MTKTLIQIIIEAMIPKFDEIHSLVCEHKKICVVTIVDIQGHTPNPVGSKMVIDAKGNLLIGTIGGGNLEFQAISVAQERLVQGISKVMNFILSSRLGQCCGGSVDLFFEVITAPVEIKIFGSGHVAQSLIPLLEQCGFSLTIIDPRAEWLKKSAELKCKANLIESDFTQYFETIAGPPGKESVSVFNLIMTHSHDEDRIILKELLKNSINNNFYIGLIGSSPKAKKFKQEMIDHFKDQSIIEKFQSPIGTPNGGKNPMEVAIAITQEMILQRSELLGTTQV